MSTFAIVVLVIAIGAVATFIAMKKGTIADANNNNIPDAIEEKVAEVKETAKKVKAVAEKATKIAKTVVVERKLQRSQQLRKQNSIEIYINRLRYKFTLNCNNKWQSQ
jgi:hypothetical protein